jgi:2-oxo-3-hexenedioate decarboxylase
MESVDEIAVRVLAAHDEGATIERIVDTNPGFDVPTAYKVSAAIVAMRRARGERPIGWKIGYTNRAVQEHYGVLHPIWGRMYDTTISTVSAGNAPRASLKHLAEPRIEPEIVLHVARTPEPGMDLTAMAACVDAVGHGFEVVTSIFRDWRGTAADSIAGGSLHGRYFHGRWLPVDKSRDWITALAEVEVVLLRNGVAVDRGKGANALGGPIQALSHFVRTMDQISGERVIAGEIVTTGTLTQAFRVAPGETWTTKVAGLPLDGMTLRFR